MNKSPANVSKTLKGMTSLWRCFLCHRKSRGIELPYFAHTVSGQNVYVGAVCYQKIVRACRRSKSGYRRPLGGLRFFPDLRAQ